MPPPAYAALPRDVTSSKVSGVSTRIGHEPFAAVLPVTPLTATTSPVTQPCAAQVITIGLGAAGLVAPVTGGGRGWDGPSANPVVAPVPLPLEPRSVTWSASTTS